MAMDDVIVFVCSQQIAGLDPSWLRTTVMVSMRTLMLAAMVMVTMLKMTMRRDDEEKGEEGSPNDYDGGGGGDVSDQYEDDDDDDSEDGDDAIDGGGDGDGDHDFLGLGCSHVKWVSETHLIVALHSSQASGLSAQRCRKQLSVQPKAVGACSRTFACVPMSA